MKSKLISIEDQKVLFPIIITALFIRLIFILEIFNTPFVEYLFSDSKIFMDTAISFVSNSFLIGNETFLIAPFYPFILAILKLFFGESTFIVYLLQVILSSISIIFIYLTAKNIFNKNIAIISAITALLFDSYIFYSGLILSETIEIFLISIILYLLSDKSKYKNLKLWFTVGVILGVTALVKENILMFGFVFIVFILFSKRLVASLNLSKLKIIGTFISGVSLIILPIFSTNLISSGEVTLISSNGGIHFYFGNNEDANGIYNNSDYLNYKYDDSGQQFMTSSSSKKLMESESSLYWYGRAYEDITSQPTEFVMLYFKKIFLFFDTHHFPHSSIIDIDFYKENISNLLMLPMVSYGIISLLSLFGLTLYMRDKNRNSFILLFLFTFIFTTAFFFVNLRFKLGITPVLIIFSSFTINQVFSHFKSKNLKSLYLPLIVVLTFVIVNTFIIEKPKLTGYDAYLHLADVAQKKDRFEEAIYNYNRSILLDDRYGTFLNLGNTFAKKGDFNNALAAYNEAEKRNSNDYYLHFNKGIVFTQIGNYDKALESYHQSLKLNPEYVSIFRNIGIIYYVSKNYVEATKYFNKFLLVSDDEETKELVKKDLENINLKLRSN